MLVSLRRRRARSLTVLLSAALAASLLSAQHPAAAQPPPNPSDGQISAAQQQKANLAAEVGRLNAAVVQVQDQLNQLQADAELAEQKFVYALQKLQDAKQASAAATKQVAAARQQVDAAQREYLSYVQATYMSGDIGGMTGSLLTAQDPNVLLEQSALQSYESEHQLDAIGNLKSATVARSNADARARLAVERQNAAAQAAQQAKQAADAAVVAAQSQQQQLNAQLASNQTALNQAQEQLATLNNERAAYLHWQHVQAVKRAQELARKRAAEAAARAAAAAAAAAAARARQQHSGSHGGGGGGGGGNYYAPSPPPAPTGGGWSAAEGQAAVARAEHFLGMMYAWAGGNASGPTYGVCAGDGAYNDCHIIGFDCSGLSLYAWAPYTSMPHYAASQYYSGSYHPSLSDLRAGDLLFWSSDGTVSGIHHVAIYIGGGMVIQAPQSGEVIQETPVGSVDWGYFGATRPLT